MTRAAAESAVRDFLADSGLEWEPGGPGTFVVTLPGITKLRTTAALTVGEHALTVNAFVARNPDENHEAVYRWLLERNRRMFAVAFAVDHLGDIYLVGRLPLAAVTVDELDGVIGAVLEYAEAVTRHVQVPGPTFEALRAHFDDRGILELTFAIAAYNMVARILEPLELRP